jgi:hypothetical protein
MREVASDGSTSRRSNFELNVCVKFLGGGATGLERPASPEQISSKDRAHALPIAPRPILHPAVGNVKVPVISNSNTADTTYTAIVNAKRRSGLFLPTYEFVFYSPIL